MDSASLAKSKLNKAQNPRGIPEDRLAEIMETACARIEECRYEMGLDNGGRGTSWAISPVARPGTWAWTRQIAVMEYKGNFIHRRALGGVFAENGEGGWSMNVPSRLITEISSKISDDIVGSDPFFAAMPDEIEDKDKAELAKEAEKKVQKEISRSNFAAACAQAIEDGQVIGERCVKLTWQTDETTYPGSATVLVDAKGQPVKTPNGNYVYQFDDVLDVVVDAKGNFVSAFDPATMIGPDGTPALPQGMAMVSLLEREPGFQMPPNPQWALFDDLEQKLVHKNGLVADVLFTEDFIWPIYSARLEEADIMAHCYDAPLDDIEARYPGSGIKDKFQLTDTGALSTAGQAIQENGEQIRQVHTRKLINIHETYFRCRVNPTDKKESWLFIVIDLVHRIPIFVEYLGNMRMKKPPFFLVRGLRSVSGRAYGVGAYEKFRDKSLAVDTFFNRLCLKSSKSASLTAYHPEAFVETHAGEDLILGGKELYKLRRLEGVEYGPNNPPVVRYNLNEVDEYSREVMQDQIQGMILETGSASSADSSSADLNASKTATGIRNIERSGNTVQRSTENMVADDITGGVEMAMDIILENMDPNETKWIASEQRLAVLNRNDIRQLPRDVRLLLTKSEASEGIEIAQQVLATLTQYYGYPPQLQKQLRPAFIQILKDLDRPDADNILHDPTDEEIKAASDAQANQSKIAEQFRAMLADFGALTPDERAQGLAKFGINASPPDQVAQAQQQAAAAENPPLPGQPPAQLMPPAGAPQAAPAPPAQPNVIPMQQGGGQ